MPEMPAASPGRAAEAAIDAGKSGPAPAGQLAEPRIDRLALVEDQGGHPILVPGAQQAGMALDPEQLAEAGRRGFAAESVSALRRRLRLPRR
jgi:hypothetical protein